MTDLDLLTGSIAARLRLIPDVARLYPARTGIDALVRTAASLLDAVADDPTVAIRPLDDGYLVETSVGITRSSPARQVGDAVRTSIRQSCAQAHLPVHHVLVRISSID